MKALTKAQCASLGGKAAAARFADKRRIVLEAFAAGDGPKRAAWKAGVGERTAKRYRAETHG